MDDISAMTPPKGVPHILRPENLTNAHRHSERGLRVLTPRELGARFWARAKALNRGGSKFLLYLVVVARAML